MKPMRIFSFAFTLVAAMATCALLSAQSQIDERAAKEFSAAYSEAFLFVDFSRRGWTFFLLADKSPNRGCLILPLFTAATANTSQRPWSLREWHIGARCNADRELAPAMFAFGPVI